MKRRGTTKKTSGNLVRAAGSEKKLAHCWFRSKAQSHFSKIRESVITAAFQIPSGIGLHMQTVQNTDPTNFFLFLTHPIRQQGRYWHNNTIIMCFYKRSQIFLCTQRTNTVCLPAVERLLPAILVRKDIWQIIQMKTHGMGESVSIRHFWKQLNTKLQ